MRLTNCPPSTVLAAPAHDSPACCAARRRGRSAAPTAARPAAARWPDARRAGGSDRALGSGAPRAAPAPFQSPNASAAISTIARVRAVADRDQRRVAGPKRRAWKARTSSTAIAASAASVPIGGCPYGCVAVEQLQRTRDRRPRRRHVAQLRQAMQPQLRAPARNRRRAARAARRCRRAAPRPRAANPASAVTLMTVASGADLGVELRADPRQRLVHSIAERSPLPSSSMSAVSAARPVAPPDRRRRRAASAG